MDRDPSTTMSVITGSPSPFASATRSACSSSAGYGPATNSSPASWEVRQLRVWRELPPRMWIGAFSTSVTVAPAVARGHRRGETRVAAAHHDYPGTHELHTSAYKRHAAIPGKARWVGVTTPRAGAGSGPPSRWSCGGGLPPPP